MSERPHILIVDDEEDWRFVLKRLLRAMEVRVTEVCDGAEVLAACIQDPPDLILMDMRMPIQSGPETCRQVRTTEATREIPIIILSSMADTDHKVEALRAGAMDYVTKPYDAEEVRARVHTQLELRRRGLEIEQQRLHLDASLQEAKALNRQLIQVNERLLDSERNHNQVWRDLHESFAHPLKALRQEAEGLRRERPCPSLHRLVGVAFQLACRLERLRGQMELEEGHPAIQPTTAPLVPVLDRLRDTFEACCIPLGISLRILADPPLADLPFRSDHAKVSWILEQLLAFACQATPAPAQVELRLFLQAEGALGIDLQASPRSTLPDPAEGPAFNAISVIRSMTELLGGRLIPPAPNLEGMHLQLSLPPLLDLESMANLDHGDLLQM